MTDRLRWIDASRAASRLTGYQTAQDYFRRLSYTDAMARVNDRIEEDQKILARWAQQQAPKKPGELT